MLTYEIDAYKFSAAFGAAASATPARTPMEVIRSVYLRGNKLIGSSLEVTVITEVDGIPADSGIDVLLPTKRLQDILAAMDGGVIKLGFDGYKLLVENGVGRFKLTTAEASSYPDVWSYATEATHGISSVDLVQSVRRTAFAVDPAAEKLATNGILFVVNGSAGEATFVATDKNRLAATSCALSGGDSSSFQCVLNRQSVQSVCSVIGSGDVRFGVNKNLASFYSGESTAQVITRIIEGRYPKWERVIPVDSPIRVEVRADMLASICKQTLVVMDPESREVTVKFRFREGILEMRAETSSVGEGVAEMPIPVLDVDDYEDVFYTGYLLDFLKVVGGGGTVEICLSEVGEAILVRQGSYRYIIMPMGGK